MQNHEATSMPLPLCTPPCLHMPSFLCLECPACPPLLPILAPHSLSLENSYSTFQTLCDSQHWENSGFSLPQDEINSCFSWTTSVPYNTFSQPSSLALCCNDLMMFFHQQTKLLFHLLNELPHCEQRESRNHVSFTVFFLIFLFIWLHQVLVAACRIFYLHCGMQDLFIAACKLLDMAWGI